MASLPKKGVTGINFQKWIKDSINGLIDYLHAARIRPGYGISVRETPSGTIVELAKKEAPTINNTTGGTGATQDISSTVSGGTATVSLSGSASSVEIVGTGDVQVSGGTNGQIILSGAGFPVWKNLVYQQITPTWTSGEMNPYILPYSGYLMIHMQPSTTYLETDGNQERDIYCYLSIDGKRLYSYQRGYYMEMLQGSSSEAHLNILTQDSTLIPVCSGSTITAEYYDSYGNTPALNLNLYHTT